jgi:hypothetical protein
MSAEQSKRNGPEMPPKEELNERFIGQYVCRKFLRVSLCRGKIVPPAFQLVGTFASVHWRRDLR